MRLREEEIELILTQLLTRFKTEHLASFHQPEDQIRSRLRNIFIDDLRVEDRLNQEVETFLEKYEKQFQSGELDRRKMFQLVKKQLVKERRLVL